MCQKIMFIAKANAKLLSFVRNDTKSFPEPLYCINISDHHDMKTIVRLEVYSSSDSDALNFLDQLGKYRDFTPRFRSLISNIGSRRYISPCFLENVLRDAQVEIEFRRVIFDSARDGHAFPTFGRDVMVYFLDCEFKSEAADAFFRGMITKSDRNIGLTGLAIHIRIPFSEEMLITLLRMNLLDTYGVRGLVIGKLSSTALCAIRESQLRSLRLAGAGFNTWADMRCFLTSLRSTVLEKLTIDWCMCKDIFPAVAVAIQHCPALIHVSLDNVWLDREDWGCLLNAFRSHTKLSSLSLKYVRWSNTTYEETALDFAAMLKENTNIDKLETASFFSHGEDVRFLEKRIKPQVEHNYYSKWFPSLHRTEAASSMRAALVAKALSNGLQGKPSIQYALLKSNVDFLRKHDW